MATETPNYKLQKPDVDDFYDVAVLNDNWDKLDAVVADRLSLSGGIMKGAIDWGNNRHISGGGAATDFDFAAGRVAIRLSPENAVGNDISKCVNIRDTSNGALYPIAIATPPQEQNLMLSSGWNIKPGGYAMFFKTQENVVHVIMSICSNAAVSAGDVIATIPVGFRPAKLIQIPIICKVSGQSELKFGHLDFGYDGTFRIYDAVSGTEIVTEMAISPFSFLAAN